ncbi:hypothetical protein J3E69DRAFT_325876 [Trichoderma sp. SZMC 28015]
MEGTTSLPLQIITYSIPGAESAPRSTRVFVFLFPLVLFLFPASHSMRISYMYIQAKKLNMQLIGPRSGPWPLASGRPHLRARCRNRRYLLVTYSYMQKCLCCVDVGLLGAGKKRKKG